MVIESFLSRYAWGSDQPVRHTSAEWAVLAEFGGHAVHRRTGLSATGVSDGLRALTEEGLAVRTPQPWTRWPADPAAVAEHLGVPELVAKIVERYRTERAAWRTFLKIDLHPRPRVRRPVSNGGVDTSTEPLGR